MAERSLVPFLLRHLANLCAPGLIVLTLFFSFVRFHDYPVWRPEVLLGAIAIISLGVPFGLLLSVRAKTFGAAVITVFLLAWSCEQLIALIPEPLSIWDSVKGRITELGGTVGLYIVTAVVSMTRRRFRIASMKPTRFRRFAFLFRLGSSV